MVKLKKFKKGAASFYIVAFSTLILVVIATSFATVIMSEISRTENDDLSQSAYDSALAGVEDAKVAFSNYRRCKEAGKTGVQPMGGGYSVSCSDIIWWMEHPDCNMVGHILGKIAKDENENAEVAVGGTVITGTDGETTTNQAYTCVQINTDLNDYRATLNKTNMVQTIRAQVGGGATNDVQKIRLSWYSVRNDVTLKYANFANDKVIFPRFGASTIAVPPTVELQIVQTAPSFTLAQFDDAVLSGSSSRTNRATLYFVPTNAKKTGDATTYIGAYNSSLGTNLVTPEQVAKTNNRTVSNKPFAVYCDNNTSEEFYCSVEVELPGVIGGGARNNNTFMLSVALPYQQPDTDFSIEMICADGSTCADDRMPGVTGGGKIAQIRNTQISIDSTGRANDLYRRVETRLETSDTEFGFGVPYYALQILGDGTTTKNLKVTHEQRPTDNPAGFYF